MPMASPMILIIEKDLLAIKFLQAVLKNNFSMLSCLTILFIQFSKFLTCFFPIEQSTQITLSFYVYCEHHSARSNNSKNYFQHRCQLIGFIQYVMIASGFQQPT